MQLIKNMKLLTLLCLFFGPTFQASDNQHDHDQNNQDEQQVNELPENLNQAVSASNDVPNHFDSVVGKDYFYDQLASVLEERADELEKQAVLKRNEAKKLRLNQSYYTWENGVKFVAIVVSAAITMYFMPGRNSSENSGSMDANNHPNIQDEIDKQKKKINGLEKNVFSRKKKIESEEKNLLFWSDKCNSGNKPANSIACNEKNVKLCEQKLHRLQISLKQEQSSLDREKTILDNFLLKVKV